MPTNPFKSKNKAPAATYIVNVVPPPNVNSCLHSLEEALTKLSLDDSKYKLKLHIELSDVNTILIQAFQQSPELRRDIATLADKARVMVDAILSIPPKPLKSLPKAEKQAIKAARQTAQVQAEQAIVNFVDQAREFPSFQTSLWTHLTRAVGYVVIAAVGALIGGAIGGATAGIIMAAVTAPAGGIGGIAGLIHGAIYGGSLGFKIGAIAGGALFGAVGSPACKYLFFSGKGQVDRIESYAKKVAEKHAAHYTVQAIVPKSAENDADFVAAAPRAGVSRLGRK